MRILEVPINTRNESGTQQETTAYMIIDDSYKIIGKLVYDKQQAQDILEILLTENMVSYDKEQTN